MLLPEVGGRTGPQVAGTHGADLRGLSHLGSGGLYEAGLWRPQRRKGCTTTTLHCVYQQFGLGEYLFRRHFESCQSVDREIWRARYFRNDIVKSCFLGNFANQ